MHANNTENTTREDRNKDVLALLVGCAETSLNRTEARETTT
jgi:hypothetical protein